MLPIDKARMSLTSMFLRTGYSFGGVVAFQSAHQLRDEGKDVRGIVLIDSPYPVNHEPLPDAVIAHVSKAGSKNDSNHATLQRISKQFQANSTMLGKYKPPQSSQPFPKVVLLRSRDTFDSEGLCGVKYPWLSDQQTRSQAIAAWEKLIGQSIQVLEIPGNHFEVFAQQNVSLTESMRTKRTNKLILMSSRSPRFQIVCGRLVL